MSSNLHSPFHCSSRRYRWFSSIFSLLLALPANAVEADGLRGRLAELAKRDGFTVDGLGKVPQQERTPAGDSVDEVLANFNHLVIKRRDGRIERIVITSRKEPTEHRSTEATIPTVRRSSQHEVTAELTGPNGRPIEVALLIDTGASTLVLPESMIAELGLDAASLEAAQSRTASDTIAVRVGVVSRVKVGGVEAEDVRVSFLPDQRLGDARLLGMSFLGRFRFSLDDRQGTLKLQAH